MQGSKQKKQQALYQKPSVRHHGCIVVEHVLILSHYSQLVIELKVGRPHSIALHYTTLTSSPLPESQPSSFPPIYKQHPNQVGTLAPITLLSPDNQLFRAQHKAFFITHYERVILPRT